MIRTITAAAAALILASCATVPPLVMTNAFDAQSVEWSKGPGTNAVKGSALMRTVAGDVKTCAGLKVQLAPKSVYTAERMKMIYGADTGGFSRADPYNLRGIPLADQALFDFVRETVCDPQGNFTFKNLPDGVYYVIAVVTWGIPTRYGVDTQGGAIMKRVEVRGGETAEVVVTS